MALCWQLGGMSGTEKAVLIALADRADEVGLCWPSVSTIAQMTCFTDRAVRQSIRSLTEKGILTVQISPGGKSNKYVVNPEPRSASSESKEVSNPERRSELNPEPRSPGTTFPRNHVPSNPEPRSPNPEPRSAKPSITHKEPSSKYIRPDDVEEKLWADFMTIRKAKKAPITDTAVAGIRRECGKAGIEFREAVAMCCERGWQTFKADWLKDRFAKPSTAPLASKNYREGVTEDGRIH